MLLPIGVFFDLFTGGDRVFRMYLWVEKKCRQPMLAAFLIPMLSVGPDNSEENSDISIYILTNGVQHLLKIQQQLAI